MHDAKLNLAGLPDWGTKVFKLKNSAGKLESKASEGRWLGCSSVSKGHRIYGPNEQIMVKQNVTFQNTLLEVPNPIPIAGEDKHGSTIKSSNQNMTIKSNLNHKPNQPAHNPSADIILCESERPSRDAGGTLVDKIVEDLEKSSGLKTEMQ